MQLDELATQEDERFSPCCWDQDGATRKGFHGKDSAAIHRKEKIAYSGPERVPVPADGANTIRDSWAIAN